MIMCQYGGYGGSTTLYMPLDHVSGYSMNLGVHAGLYFRTQ